MNEVIGTLVLHSVENGICRIVLNRPEVANAIAAAQREAIIGLLEQAGRDSAVRVVVLASNGKHFCSGADIEAIAEGGLRAGEAMQRIMNGAQRLVAAVLDCGKPVIAAVQGTAAGLGAHLAFACDLVVAAEEAGFIEIFVRRGLTVDAGGAYLLPRLVGVQKAKELVFFGDKVSARDAHALGLVNRVVADAELAATVDALAARLATGPTTAISLAKRLINKSLDTDRGNAFLEEAMAQEVNSRSEDATEGVKAFIERRTPQFKGY
ncbi:enoyl-CoA hydratase/isomerase family protein [Thauera sinica]|uniref:Enoyl-CoA hydratase/isomerase family protein n=1 Tax=Thauera sinica TaxID=2665146 RepID=A0ABW1AY62_9RHOO|nr:enoyl-CoA hydratase-related protein [Thauera sp. K11]ATE58760.1 enoyl-CoA hydratase [Thauera sp. K11]